MSVPSLRARAVNAAPARDGDYVLFWMTSARRRHYNFALQHAVDEARARELPLVILEPLRIDARWTSDRFVGFVLDGMADNARAFADVTYHPYVETSPGAGKGLLAAMAARAAIVVVDYLPSHFLPRMLTAAGKMLDVRLDAVDGNGLLPIAAAQTDFPTAYVFRRFLQKSLLAHLADQPRPDPLAGVSLPRASISHAITTRWPSASPALLRRDPAAIAALPIDHTVGLVERRGGASAAGVVLDAFMDVKLARYAERNHPDVNAASGLSPYLHWGHLAAHEVFARIVEREDWTPARASKLANGRREGWWGMSAESEAFLDELVTWRELGFNHCARNPARYDRYESLPSWARATLEDHASDPRPYRYTLAELTEARTHDEVWNAAQRELVATGGMHNYLRMLWGKKILEWSASPKAALAAMIELNNRWALDGRDPNSYSGIFWVLGRYDRPWAPQRAIFGSIRYMSSANTVKKLRMRSYLARYGG